LNFSHNADSLPLFFYGEVYSYATAYEAAEGFEGFVPYTVGIIKLDDGPSLSAQLTDVDSDDVTIGMKVEMVTRKLREKGDSGLIIYGYKFRPLLQW
jgi:uncharacterized OB-fold protein